MSNLPKPNNIKSKNSLLLIFFLLLAVAITLIIVSNRRESQDLRSKAAAPSQEIITQKSPESLIPEEKKPEFVKGEVLVKFKADVKPIQTKPDRLAIVGDVGKMSVSYDNLDLESIPLVLQDIQETSKIANIEKVFKNSRPPSEELADFKSRFPDRINKIKPQADDIDLSRIYKLKLANPTDTLFVLQMLQESRQVEYAEPNLIVNTTQIIPNDPYYLDSYPDNIGNRDPNWNPAYDYLWNLKQIKMSEAWEVATGSASIIVAVSDTGVDYTHPELGGCSLDVLRNNQCPLVTSGYNFLTNTDDPMDDNTHGTHVVGIITAMTNNATGIAGVGWNTRIMPLKFLAQNGSGTISGGAASIYWAVDNGAQIINTSWGSIGSSQTLVDAASYAESHGVLWVAAAGNDNLDVSGQTPANISCPTPEGQNLDCVLTVAATDQRNLKSEYSNWGTGIDIAAPGGDGGFWGEPNVISLKSSLAPSTNSSYFVGDSYIRKAGTSMAAPHVSGLAALILSALPNSTVSEVRNIMTNGSDDLGDEGYDIYYGHGRINAGKSLKNPDTSNPPVAKISIPFPNMLLGRVFSVKGTASALGFLNYTLDYASSPAATIWSSEGITLVNNGKNPVSNADLAKVDLSQLSDGTYYFRLRVNTTSSDTGLSIVTFRLDSTVRQGFPVNYGTPPYWAHPVTADVNLDGTPEIVTRNLLEYKIYVYKMDGSVLAGWPQPTQETSAAYYDSSTPLILDFDKNYPGLEIFSVSYPNASGRIILGYHADGTPVSNWTLGDWIKREKLGYTYNNTFSAGIISGSESLVYAESLPLVSGQPKLHAYRLNATEPAGFPILLPDGVVNKNDQVVGTSRLGDIDGDGLNEIIVKQKGAISTYNSAGQLMFKKSGNPRSLILADIDGDLKDEIISFGGNLGYGDVQNTIDVLDETGNSQSPWPINLPLTQNPNYAMHLAVSDFDGDNLPDIMATTFLGDQYAYGSTDQSLPGFPRSGGPVGLGYSANFGSNTTTQILAQTGRAENNSYPPEELYLESYDSNTGSLTPVTGFPKIIGAAFESGFMAIGQPTLLNSDSGQMSLAVAGTMAYNERYLYVFDLAATSISPDWLQYLHDAQHTGNASYRNQSVTPTPTNTPTPTVKLTPKPTLTPTPTLVSSQNLILNPGFEMASDDRQPDNWTKNSRFTRRVGRIHSGSYSGRHYATDNASYNINQTVNNVTGNTSYAFSGWTNIPDTSDSFTYKIQLIWKNASGSNLRTDTLKTYNANTGGWKQTLVSKVSPANAASVVVRMKVESLNARIFADDFSIRKE